MKITANSNVKHNGKWYKDGESLGNVKKEDAERLIALGVAIEAPVEQEDDSKSSKTEKNSSSSKKTEDE